VRPSPARGRRAASPRHAAVRRRRTVRPRAVVRPPVVRGARSRTAGTGSPRATAEVSWNGERKRTVYSITPRGAEALRDWLADDPAPQRVESVAAVRILFGHLGTKDDLQAAIARVAADADEWITRGFRGRRRLRPRRRTVPRAHPRQRAPRHAHDRAGADGVALGDLGGRGGRTMGRRRDSRRRVGCPDAAARARRGAVQRRALRARSIWRFASRSARSRRLSMRSLPRATASSTLTRPSLK